MMLDNEKVADFLRLVAGVSAVLGHEWTSAQALLTHTKQRGGKIGHYPVAVDLYSEAGGGDRASSKCGRRSTAPT